MASSEYYVADNSDMENKKLEAAKNHYSTGNYSAALQLYLSMLNSSMSYKLYHRIGKCYYKMNDLKLAEEYFERSTKLEPQNNPSFYYLGVICYKRTDIRGAISNWVKSFAYKPDDENVSMNLATSYFSLGMRFQSIFYYDKYLKYAENNTEAYKTVKTSLDEYNRIGMDFMQKAKQAIARKDTKAAIDFLFFAVKNLPISFDINYVLGSLYLQTGDNMHAMIYLKQALCLDSRSMDTLQKLISVFINLGDYTSAYCMMRRLLPLVIHNQEEYLKTLKMIKDLSATFDDFSYKGHKEWGDNYYNENNYHFALIEYENCVILKDELQEEYSEKIEEIKSYIYPEVRAAKNNLATGNKLLLEGNNREANKYFTKVMKFSDENSSEYKMAKSRIVNV